MASVSKRVCYHPASFDESEQDSDVEGMSSSEESEIDRGLSCEELSFEFSDEESMGGQEDDDHDDDNITQTEIGSNRVWSKSVSAPSGRGVGDGSNGMGQNTKSYADLDVGNNLPAFKPTRPPGVYFKPVFLRNRMTTAAEFFHLYFTVEMIDSIVSHTNSYAYTKIAEGSCNSYTKADGSWEETTPDEINRFIGILIYFSLVKIGSSFNNYWSTKTLYHGLWARSILSRLRFKALMAFLHVVDPMAEVQEEKLNQVGSFLKNFKERCKLLYQPQQNMAVDERMIKSRHMSGIQQFMKNKPIRWGIKLWVLTDSSNGYTMDFDVYIGKDAGRVVSKNGLGYDVVMKLVQPFLHQGYHLFFDHFYTSFQLVNDLFKLGVPSTGTVSTKQRVFPESLKDIKKWVKRVERGSMRWERTSPCLFLQWRDNKPVSLITTIDNANDIVTVKRRTKIDNVWKKVNVQQPEAIRRYNYKYINKVDRSDEILTCNSISGKCHKWWKTLFFHLIDVAIVNSFILFREHRAKFPDTEALQRPPDYSISDFREEIVRQLCGFPEYDVPPALSKVPPPGEFDVVHMPVFSQSGTRRNCVVCYKQGRGELRVSTYCSAPQCGRYLHFTMNRNCFREWHSKAYHGH